MRFSPLVNDALYVLAENGLTGAVKEGRHYKVQFINQFGCGRGAGSGVLQPATPCSSIATTIAASPSARRS
jgi:hypothetical protein